MCDEHLVGGRNEVAALVGGCFVAALVVHTAHAVDDVEVAVICLDRFAVVCEREVAALVDDLDGTEVLEVTLVAVGSGTCPEGLLVELDFIFVESATNGCADLSVAQRQRIFHPGVGHAGMCDGHVVPEREVIDVGGT